MNFILILAISTLLSYVGTKLAIKLLSKAQIFDIPNERSNHKTPTLRGAGAAIADTILLGILLVYIYFIDAPLWQIVPLLIGGTLLAIVSFIDDLKGVSIILRLGCQLVAVVLGLVTLLVSLETELTVWILLSLPVLTVLWVWFINAFNFMDGIDGISATETLTITLSIGLLTMANWLPPEYEFYSAVVAGSALGFIFFNWHPAKVFMGDVGSVTLGYFLGWLLLGLVLKGYYLVAILLPFYYLIDSGVTLFKRALAGEKIWEAHSSHFYQKAVRRGKAHSEVVISIAKYNCILFVLSFLAILMPQSGLFLLLVAIFSAYIFIRNILLEEDSADITN
jgi:UDP-N-acetylmuramyl pentapeptide phosphotransferase/UDP-N-acetylglucosamine-1-phosphate transferase